MKKRLMISILLVCALLLAAGCSGGGSGLEPIADPTAKPASTATARPVATAVPSHKAVAGQDLRHAEIVIKDRGTITLELDEGAAPVTVGNFIKLAQNGFYDGLTFHRIMKGFMMQGGDPKGDGTGGAEGRIYGEFSANGYENPLKHTRGTISMARSSVSYNTASSQFFIVHEDSDFLDGNYAAFGHVTGGMEIVDDICENTPVEDDNGTVAAENRPVIERITVLD